MNMKQITLLLTIFTIFMGFCSFAYSNGDTAEVVVFGDPSIFPRDAEDNTIPATVRVFNRPEYSYLIIYLVDNSGSDMPGVCVNFPIDAADNGEKDLELRKADNSTGSTDRWEDWGNGRLKYNLPDNPDNATKLDVPVKIFCHDYGAWGVLKAELWEKTSVDTGDKLAEDTGSVPRDENENHIPDDYCDDFLPETGYVYVEGKKEKEEVNVAKMRKQTRQHTV